MKTKRTSTAVQRWGKCALTLLLACALLAGLAITASARGTDWQGEVVDPAIPKPTVTIQGNLVVDKPGGKPTGFYELALCVRSGRTIYGPDPAAGYAVGTEKELTEAEYAQVLSDIEKNLVPMGITQDSYTLTYYPFRTATAAVNVNTDILTAVNWAIQNVTYQSYDPATGYAKDAADPGAYPRGIDTDVAVQGYDVLGLTTAEAFPDITTPDLLVQPSVAIDVEGDSRMFAATGQVDYYDATANAALLTLSASAPSNKSIILTEDTPLVVARFSYDLKRFPDTKVNTTDWQADVHNSATGKFDEEGLWLGWDKSDVDPTDLTNGLKLKTPLTWLGESVNNNATGGDARDFTDMDRMIARTRMNQSVWVHMETNSEDLTQRDTYFYYYLDAEENRNQGQQTLNVNVNGKPTAVPGITIPKTAGAKVLTEGTQENPVPTPNPSASPAPTQANYTFFRNLLRLNAPDRTLVVKLVNDVTFKKPAGVGGNIIEFYDWDDTYLGSLIVGDGDVRDTVNEYVEKNMVHPDLRAGDILANKLGGNLPDFTQPITPGSDAEEYANILNSLDREYTYRGKYSSKVDGTGVVRDEAGEVATDPNSVPGKEYKLTNKIDYAFYRHLNTVTTLEYQDAGGNTVSERYITTQPLTSNADAAQYPWAYGWAIVEDNSVRNQNSWQARRDGAQVENTWTTFGVGELTNADPAYDTAANPGVQAVPTALPAGAVPVPGSTLGGGTGIETSWPDFVDTATVTAPTDYAYKLDKVEGNDYLRFADFSDMKAQFSKTNQNVLVVKAVYEPGPELMVGYNYQMIEKPYYNKLRNEAANNGGAYSMEVTMERTTLENPADGKVRGVSRVREAVVRQDTTADEKWVEDVVKGVNHDLANATKAIAIDLVQTTFTKVDIDNGEEISFSLALSPRQNRVDYWIIDAYNFNFAAGGQRSGTNYNRTGDEWAVDNYNYYMAGESDEGDIYYDPVNYTDREGSRGFVLYGTLNNMLELATGVNRGGSDASFIIGVAYDTMQDANLRDKDGAPADVANEYDIQQAILAAAKECETSHKGDPDYWNSKRDCAELTYHQLQHYIQGKGLMTRAQADADKIAWCHLHKDCADASAGVPKTWNDLMVAALAGDSAAIEKLLPSDIASITNLRSDANGQANFVVTAGTPGNFADRIITAVQALDAAGTMLSWDNVQYAILNPGTVPADDSYARANYWWYDGATMNLPPSKLEDLVTMVQAANVNDPTLMPDGTPTGSRTAKLVSVKPTFDANDDGTDKVATAWNRLTENLVMSADISQVSAGIGSTTKFTDFATFISAMQKAIKKDTANTLPSTDSDYWYKLQYAILHPDETSWPTTLPTECDDYYWHNDGKLYVINDLPSMLTMAGLINDGDTAALDFWNNKFDLAMFQACTDMTDFSLNFVGTDDIDNLEHDGSTVPEPNEFDDFKAKILALDTFCATNTWFDLDETTNANLWKDVQFWLLHDESEVKPGVSKQEHQYYWWEDNGTPIAVTLEGKQGDVESWLNAAFMEVYNGNTAAWDNLSADEADGSNSKFNATRLRNPAAEDVTAGNTKYQKPDEIPMLSAADVKTKMNALITEIMAGKTGHAAHRPPNTITWYQVQDYLITGTYTATPSAAQQVAWEKQYWWLVQDENPDKPHEEVNTEMLDLFISTYLQSDTTVNTVVKDALISNEKGDLNFRKTPTMIFSAPPHINTAKTRLKSLLKYVAAVGQDKSTLTWYQIQWALLDDGNGTYLTPNQAYHKLKDTAADWAPEWVKKLPEPPAPEPLNNFITTYLQSDATVNTVNKDALAKTSITDATLGTIELGDLTFRKTATMAFSAPPHINTAKTRLKKLIADPGVATQGGVNTLTWYQIQYALIDEGNGAYKTPLEAYQWAQALPVTWAPPCATTAAVPEGASLNSLDIGMAEPEQSAEPTVEELLAQKAELERQLELLEEQIKAAKEAEANVGAAVPSGPQDPVVPPTVAPTPAPEPEEPATPAEPDDPTPVEPSPEPTPEPTDPETDYDEREETPEGEDARAATILTSATVTVGADIIRPLSLTSDIEGTLGSLGTLPEESWRTILCGQRMAPTREGHAASVRLLCRQRLRSQTPQESPKGGQSESPSLDSPPGLGTADVLTSTPSPWRKTRRLM